MKINSSRRWLAIALSSILLLSISSANIVFGDTITVGASPRGVAINENTNTIYVTNTGSNTVSVIDGSTNSVVTSINVGNGPFGVDVNTLTNTVYATNDLSNTVSVIDGSTNSVVTNIVVGTTPRGIAVNEITNMVYVANFGANTVSVIDGSTNSVVSTITVGNNPVGLDVDPNTGMIYVANLFSNTVSVIDGSTNSVVTNITVGPGPSFTAVNSNTGRIYVTNFFSTTLSVIDGSTNSVISIIQLVGNPGSAAVDKNQDRVFVTGASSNIVSMIDGSTNSVVATIPTGAFPRGIAVNEITNMVYVANFGANTVSVIDISGNNPPTANAGIDQDVNEGNLVALDGTPSSDPDGDALTFVWTQTAGPPVTLSSVNTATPTFLTPQVNAQTVLTFQLVVSDGTFNSLPDLVNVVVNDLSTIQVPLTAQITGVLTADVNIGDIATGSTITLQFLTPPGALPNAQLEKTVIPVGPSGTDVTLNFEIASQVPTSLPPTPEETVLFFDIDFTGIDFSDVSAFQTGQLPASIILVDRDVPYDERFQDGCPVVPVFLLNENLGQWEQIGNPTAANANRAYVTNGASGTVSVIDTSTNTVIDTITVDSGAFGIAFDPTTNRVYVTNTGSGTVSVIDTSTNSLIDTITVGSAPFGVAIVEETNRIYVTNAGSNTVSVIDTSTNTVIDTITVGNTPTEITFNPNTNSVYVINFLSSTLMIIDTSTNTVIDTITVGNAPGDVTVDPDTNRIYVPHFLSNTLTVIDGSTNTVIDTITVGNAPVIIAINQNTNRAYVANTGSGTVSVIDTSTNTVIDTIDLGTRPTAVDINLNTNKIYVTDEHDNTLTVIDGSTNTVIDTITVGNIPHRVAVNPNVTNPIRNSSFDVIDPNTGEVILCAYEAQLPHLSKFAVGRPVKATSIGSGGSDGGIFRGRSFAFADPDRTGYDGDAPRFGQVLTESGGLKVLAQILDSTGVKDSKLIVSKNTILMQRRSGTQNWWEGTIPSNLLSGDTVFFKIVARDYNHNVGEYSGSASIPAGTLSAGGSGASFVIKPLTVGYQSDSAYSITTSGIRSNDQNINPQITIKNNGNEPLQNIRLVLSPELKGKFLLSDYAIKKIDPQAEYTVSLKLNGRPNVDEMGEPMPYTGNVIISVDNGSPYILELSGNIPNESTSLQSLFMKTITSKAEQRYKTFEKPELRISQPEYQVTLGSGENTIRSASDELIIHNTGDKPLKNLRIMTSAISDHFIPEQKNIGVIPAGSFIKIKLVSKLSNVEPNADLSGELLIAPENGVPVTIPINIGKTLREDKNSMYEVRTISGNGAVSNTADGIVIRNNSEEAIQNIRIILPRELARVLSLSDDSFKSMEPRSEKIIYLQQRGTFDGRVKQIVSDYVGEMVIVSSDGMKKIIPVNIVWKDISSEHFVINARDNAEELAKAAQVINFLERSYAEKARLIGETDTKTVIYMTSSLDELKMLSNALTPSTLVYAEDVGFVWSNSEDVNLLALKQSTSRTIVQNYATYWTKQKISLDKGNWLVDGISNYVAASIVGERGMIKDNLEAFIAEPVSFEWYGAASTPSQYGASYTLFKLLADKYGDGIIDKILNNLGSTMVSNHRCDTFEQCALVKGVYDIDELNINDKRHEISFATIMEEWKKYVHEEYSVDLN